MYKFFGGNGAQYFVPQNERISDLEIALQQLQFMQGLPTILDYSIAPNIELSYLALQYANDLALSQDDINEVTNGIWASISAYESFLILIQDVADGMVFDESLAYYVSSNPRYIVDGNAVSNYFPAVLRMVQYMSELYPKNLLNKPYGNEKENPATLVSKGRTPRRF